MLQRSAGICADRCGYCLVQLVRFQAVRHCSFHGAPATAGGLSLRPAVRSLCPYNHFLDTFWCLKQYLLHILIYLYTCSGFPGRFCNKTPSSVFSTINPYPTAFPYGNGMVLHFYQQQESSTTKTVHKVINKGLKTYV